jgi:aspartate aminotransferase
VKLASRMERIGTETAFEAAARARALEAAGRSVIHLELGEPDFDTPRHISEAAVQGLLEGRMTHYPPATGIAPLKEAIAADVRRWKGIEATPEQVVVTPGAKPIMFYAMLALIEEGDEVIYPNPGFPIYESMIRYVGGTAVAAPLREASDFRMDVEEVAGLVTARTRMIVINSPHNPTGSILTADDLRQIARIAVERDLVVLADEIYGRLQYEGEPLSIATLPGMAERTITLDGFSKTFAMTGWRLGYGIVPDWLAPSYSRLVINSVSGTSAFAQAGAVAALTGPQDEPERMRAEFIARRALIVDGLNAIPGVSCVLPHGAFYAFPNVGSFGRSSSEIADHLLYDAGVCGLAGTAFGQHGEGYIRFSYANSRANIEAALERIGESLVKLERTGELVSARSVTAGSAH